MEDKEIKINLEILGKRKQVVLTESLIELIEQIEDINFLEDSTARINSLKVEPYFKKLLEKIIEKEMPHTTLRPRQIIEKYINEKVKNELRLFESYKMFPTSFLLDFVSNEQVELYLTQQKAE